VNLSCSPLELATVSICPRWYRELYACLRGRSVISAKVTTEQSQKACHEKSMS
jgi:hypothetical protein